jgi:hypothetical protein
LNKNKSYGAYMQLSYGVKILGMVVLLTTPVLAQNHNHPYPRIAVFHFGDPVPDWYARFDLVISNSLNDSRASEVKRLNPNVVLLPTTPWTVVRSQTRQWFPEGTEAHWLAVEASGEVLHIDEQRRLVDLTNFCPRYNGERFNEAFPKFVAAYHNLNIVDGIASDWLWYKPHGVEDIDLDRNGSNDYSEHGESWVIEKWTEGVETLLSNLRNVVGEDKYIVPNSGLFHSYGWSTTNGMILEHTTGVVDWNYLWRNYKEWMAKSRKPHFLLVDGRPHGAEPDLPGEEKNYFRLMRFLLTVTMLGDGYFNFFDNGAGEHHYHRYYDEFDLNVGFPTSDAFELPNGCFVRFFDHGAVITNPTGSTQTVTNGQISTAPGFAGPYYRFKGGQAPDWNNGAGFNSITLEGFEWDRRTYGDGIILVREPAAIVSDIIVDNLDYGTSPMSEPTRFSGSWSQTDRGENGYTIIDRARSDWYPLAFSSAGSGDRKATFIPTIGVAGEYEVLEWHGDALSGPQATNTPFRITSADGVENVAVNQAVRIGQWNSIGRYNFAAGTRGTIEITNNANGVVVADAIKLVYLDGTNFVVDLIPPAEPKGIRVE